MSNQTCAGRQILFYANIDPDRSNAGTLHVTGLAKGFAKNGNAVQLLVPRPAPTAEIHKMLADGIRIATFPRARIPGFRTVWSLGTLLACPALVRLLRLKPAFLYVREDQSTWLIHAVARLFDVPSFGEHNSLVSFDRGKSSLSALKVRLFDFGQRLSCRLASHSFSVTDGIKKELVVRGADATRVSVIGNGTDLVSAPIPERNECLRQLGLPPENIYAGFFGHLVWWQGCDQLLKAFAAARARNSRLSLVFAGEGSMAPALRKMASAIGVSDSVHFLGGISYEQRSTIIGAIDIACFPGVAERNVRQGVASLKIRDYAACGRAIISAALPGTEDMIVAGAIQPYRPDDISDLEEKLVQLADDAGLRSDLGASARTYASRHFRWSAIAAEICAKI